MAPCKLGSLADGPLLAERDFDHYNHATECGEFKHQGEKPHPASSRAANAPRAMTASRLRGCGSRPLGSSVQFGRQHCLCVGSVTSVGMQKSLCGICKLGASISGLTSRDTHEILIIAAPALPGFL